MAVWSAALFFGGKKEMKSSYLIDNNTHELLAFKSIAELKRYTKEHDMVVKPSPSSDNCFYTESYVILPTGYKD